MAPDAEGDWGEYRRLILQELQRLHDGIAEVKNRIDMLHASDLASIKSEIAVLKFKAGVLGLVAGTVPGVIGVLYSVLHK